MLLLQVTACGGGGEDHEPITDSVDDGTSTEDSGIEETIYTVSGLVTGLTGDGMLIQINAEEALAITTNNEFTFASGLHSGETYDVVITNQPSNQICRLLNGSGTISEASVTNIRVRCPLTEIAPTVISSGTKLLRFSWDSVDADHYKLLKNIDGNSGFKQIGDDITTTIVDEEISVHLTNWPKASYLVQACNAIDVCTDSETVSISSLMLDTIGYLKSPSIWFYKRFGRNTVLSDDATTLVTSSTSNSHIYQRIGYDWREQAMLSHPFFDMSLSANGDTLAISDLTESSTGAVRIFEYNGSFWSQQAFIKASNAESNDSFGSQVSLSSDGNILAIAAAGEDSSAGGINGDQTDNSASDSGAVYMFERNDNSWHQQAYIKASNPKGNDDFGAYIALSADGNTLAISSRETNSVTNRGMVYIFIRSDDGDWQLQENISSYTVGNKIYTNFTPELALSGNGNLLALGYGGDDTSAIGVNGIPSNNTVNNSGAVILYERKVDGWDQIAHIKASNAEAEDLFGARIDLSTDGSTLAVTAIGEDSIATGINGDQFDNSSSAYPPGAVYIFNQTHGLWQQIAYVKASNTDTGWDWVRDADACGSWCVPTNDCFGDSIALSADGGTLVVGAPDEKSGVRANQQDNSEYMSGAVYSY